VKLRVLVYNVWGFRHDAGTVAASIADLRPDLALVQECGSRRRLRMFARALEMHAVSTRLFPLVRQVRNAILVRPPWRVVSYRFHRFGRSQRFYPRGALIAVLGRAGYRISALSAHLGLAPVERFRQAKELADLALGLPGPVLIGADVNEDTGGKAASWLADRFWDAWARAGEGSGETFPSRDPTARIDYLFASEHLRIEWTAVVDTEETRGASDHLPLIVDLSID
jgi:endonuclease/exonuclease/phosphatase family metal-dependent hydrolase